MPTSRPSIQTENPIRWPISESLLRLDSRLSPPVPSNKLARMATTADFRTSQWSRCPRERTNREGLEAAARRRVRANQRHQVLSARINWMTPLLRPLPLAFSSMRSPVWECRLNCFGQCALNAPQCPPKMSRVPRNSFVNRQSRPDYRRRDGHGQGLRGATCFIRLARLWRHARSAQARRWRGGARHGRQR